MMKHKICSIPTIKKDTIPDTLTGGPQSKIVMLCISRRAVLNIMQTDVPSYEEAKLR